MLEGQTSTWNVYAAVLLPLLARAKKQTKNREKHDGRDGHQFVAQLAE